MIMFDKHSATTGFGGIVRDRYFSVEAAQ
jgi:hypothetical protein